MEEDLLYRAYKTLEHVYDCDSIDDNHILDDKHLNLMTDVQNYLSNKYNIDWREI